MTEPLEDAVAPDDVETPEEPDEVEIVDDVPVVNTDYAPSREQENEE